jgi:hypothetical protein
VEVSHNNYLHGQAGTLENGRLFSSIPFAKDLQSQILTGRHHGKGQAAATSESSNLLLVTMFASD